MIIDVHFVEDMHDLAAFIDQKSLAGDSHVGFAHEFLFAVNAEQIADNMLGIGNERRRQPVLCDEFLMFLVVVERYADRRNILFRKGVVCITKRTCFLRSARCQIFRVKEKRDALSAKPGHRHLISIFIFRRKIRRVVSDFQHSPPVM